MRGTLGGDKRSQQSLTRFQTPPGRYQRTRLPPTASLTLKSVLVGKLETQAGAGAVFRDALIGTLARIGVAKQIFLDGAAVRV